MQDATSVADSGGVHGEASALRGEIRAHLDGAWRIDTFTRSLTSLSDRTVEAYVGDLRAFAEWCSRGGSADPAAVTRTVVRRYVAFLTTRRFARRSIARK